MRWPFSPRRPGDNLPELLGPLRPWRTDRPGILAHVETQLRAGVGSLTSADLPDEEPRDGGISWAPGAMDGVWATHGSPQEQAALAASIIAALRALATQPGIEHARALYGFLMEHGALSVVDTLLPQLVDRWPLPAARLRDIALWIIRGSPDREPVKYAIALLGISGDDADRDLLFNLGRHEEFTMYSAVALQHSAGDPEEAMWQLARLVDGWGRVHIVQRLADTARADIRRWLVTEGCSNSIMPEYTALLCARSGGLLEALEDPGAREDAALLGGAAVIIQALLTRRGPAEGLESSEHPQRLLSAFIGHVGGLREPGVEHLTAVHGIAKFLGDAEVNWDEGSLASLTPEVRQEFAARCRHILESGAARGVIERGLASGGDDFVFNCCADLAAGLGADVWEHRFARLAAGSHQWYWVLETRDVGRLERVLEHARRTLPLEGMPGAPTEQILARGPDAEHYSALDSITAAVRPFPGLGWDLVRVALSTPYTRLRNMAAATLDEWPRDRWPSDAADALAAAAGREVRDELRKTMQDLLKR